MCRGGAVSPLVTLHPAAGGPTPVCLRTRIVTRKQLPLEGIGITCLCLMCVDS